MKRRRPAIAAIITLGYTLGCAVSVMVLALAAVLLFLNQSDEAWSGLVWGCLTISAIALPLGVLLAIGSYFKAGMAPTENQRPNQTAHPTTL